jgi:hypothetical protein
MTTRVTTCIAVDKRTTVATAADCTLVLATSAVRRTIARGLPRNKI